jgi:hypothetical protein
MFLAQVGVGISRSGVKQLSPEILDDAVLGARGVLLGDGECGEVIKISGLSLSNSSRFSQEDQDLVLPWPGKGKVQPNKFVDCTNSLFFSGR